MVGRVLVLSALVVGAALAARDVGACSCLGPSIRFLTPNRLDDAPRNVRVRFSLPRNAKTAGRWALRPHGSPAEAAITTRTLPYGEIETLEIEPTSPLAPSTQYEVANIDDVAHPPVTVYGTFTTGTELDTTAPTIDEFGAVRVKRAPQETGGSSCGRAGPWIEIDKLRGKDPGRPEAQLVLGAWVSDASGRIDESKPPTVIDKNDSRHQVNWYLGNASVCDPRSFPFPKGGGSFVLGLALLDEAGNRSAMKRVSLNVGAAGP